MSLTPITPFYLTVNNQPIDLKVVLWNSCYNLESALVCFHAASNRVLLDPSFQTASFYLFNPHPILIDRFHTSLNEPKHKSQSGSNQTP